jgi:hypothetical protein
MNYSVFIESHCSKDASFDIRLAIYQEIKPEVLCT